MPTLPQTDIDEIHRITIETGLVADGMRALLLGGLPAQFAAELPQKNTPGAQLRSDLDVLNRIERMDGIDEPPLALWLARAAAQLGQRPEGQRLVELRARCLSLPPPPGEPSRRPRAIERHLAQSGVDPRVAAVLECLRWPLRPRLWRSSARSTPVIRVVSLLARHAGRAAQLGVRGGLVEVSWIAPAANGAAAQEPHPRASALPTPAAAADAIARYFDVD